MKTIAYICALIAIAYTAAPAEAKRSSGSKGCTMIESTGSSGVTRFKAKMDADKAWRIDASRQVSGAAADRMTSAKYDCNKQGAGVFRHINWVCSVRALACAGQRWND